MGRRGRGISGMEHKVGRGREDRGREGFVLTKHTFQVQIGCGEVSALV